MTTWIENPTGGRDRGPRALVRAGVEVLLRPSRFFRTGVGPGDQAPGLTFAIAVAVAFSAGWMLTDPAVIPGITGNPLVSALVVVLVVGLLAAPAGLHLSAAITVIAVAALVDDRAGVSETVQVLAYATAPMAIAGPPIPALRGACAIYGAGLLVYGLKRVHGTSWARATLAAILPAIVAFGVGYRTFATVRPVFGT